MVNIFVGVPDNDWLDYLSARQVEEVNFWSPSGRTHFRALQPGELFLFKLHSRIAHICRGFSGRFVPTFLPAFHAQRSRAAGS
ncbi:hypothetical protein [Mesorhizobium sp. 43Arga]